MSRANQILNILDNKSAPIKENGVITRKFKDPSSKPAMNEVSPQEIVQAVLHAINNFKQDAPVSALKAQLIPVLTKMVPGKYDESMPMKRHRYEVPANKVGAIAEVLKIKFKGKDIVVEEKEDAVEVLSKEDVADIVLDVLKQLGLVDDAEVDEEHGLSAGGGDGEASGDGDELRPAGSLSVAAAESKNSPFGKKAASLDELRNDTKRMKSLLTQMAD